MAKYKVLRVLAPFSGLVGSVVYVSPVFAATTGDASPFINLIKNATTLLASVGGALAIGFLVYGGILYITSGGDLRNHDKAKGVIKNAVIGLVIVLAATAIGTLVSTLGTSAFGS
jgi:hypothetical protein